MQCGERILGDGTLVHVTPHLQAHQSHSDIQSPVELRGGERRGTVGKNNDVDSGHRLKICFP